MKNSNLNDLTYCLQIDAETKTQKTPKINISKKLSIIFSNFSLCQELVKYRKIVVNVKKWKELHLLLSQEMVFLKQVLKT